MRRALSLALSAAVALAYGHLPVSAADDTVEIQDNQYAPASITVAPGTMVTWTQTGNLPHSVTSDAPLTSDDSFDSHPGCSFATGPIPGACMATGDMFQHTFENVGSFAYYCRVHGGAGGVAMSGVIIVEVPDETSPPPPPPPPSPPDPLPGGETGQEQVAPKEEQKLKKCEKKARKKAKKKKSKKKSKKARKKAIKKCKKKFGRVG